MDATDIWQNSERQRFRVYATESGGEQIYTSIQSLLEILNPLQSQNNVLRHLWHELTWLKTTARDGKVILPNSFEMILFQAARGEFTEVNKHPVLRQRVNNLAAALNPLIEG